MMNTTSYIKQPPFTNAEFSEITSQLGPYVQRIDILQHIASGKSGAEVWLVQLILDEDKFENKLMDEMKRAFETAPEKFDELCYRLKYDREANRQRDDKLLSELVRLTNKALRRHDNLSLAKLLEKFTRTFPDRAAAIEMEPCGPYYLKIHRDTSNRQNLDDYLELTRQVRDVDVHLPELAAHLEYKDFLLALYRPAYDSINFTRVKPLGLIFDAYPQTAKMYVERTATWLRRWNDHYQIAEAKHPHSILCDILGERRVEGTENVQERVKRLLRKIQAVRQSDMIETAQMLRFDYHEALPNPVAYLHHYRYWDGANLRWGNTPLGRSHGDLHCGNIMCLRSDYPATASDLEGPDIIDFGDYQPNQVVFFDLLYFEFDLILKHCPPDDPENREFLWDYICNYLMGSDEDVVPSSRKEVPLQLGYANPLIINLRQIAEDYIETSRYADDFRAAFWLTAVAVGLNYARKETLKNDYERLLGLMYAGAALRHVLRLYGAEERLTGRGPTAENVIDLFWVNVDFTHPQESIETVIPEIRRLIESNKKLLFVCSPDMTTLDMEGLLQDLQNRLSWLAPQEAVQGANLAELLHLYREYASDLNVREAIRFWLRKKDRKPNEYLDKLSQLNSYKNVAFAIFDWDDLLEKRLYGDRKYNPAVSEENCFVLHLLGDTLLPETVCYFDDFTSDGIAASDGHLARSIHQCAEDVMRKSHVVFIGKHDFDSEPYQTWLQVLAANRRAQGLKVWYVTDNPVLSGVRNDVQMTVAAYDPLTFLQELLASPLSAPVDVRTAAVNLEEYQFEVINYNDIIRDIFAAEEAKPWFIYSLPGTGKSSMLRRLCDQHSRDLGETPPYPIPFPTSTVVDLLEDRRMATREMALLQVLFDRFEVPIQTPPGGTTNSPETTLNNLWDYFLGRLQFRPYPPGSKILICIDSVDVAGESVAAWLRDACVDALERANRRRRTVPIRLVVTRRLSYRDGARQTLPERYRKEWHRFKQDRLPELGKQHIIEMVNNYIDTAPFTVDNAAQLASQRAALRVNWNANQGEAAMQQAEYYLDFCHNNMYAVVELVKKHVEDWLVQLGSYPDEMNEGECLERLYRPIDTCIVRAVQCRTDPGEWETRKQQFRHLLMCRRLNPDIVANVCPPSSTQPAQPRNVLAELNAAEFFYAPFGANNPFGSWYLVTPSYHLITVDYFRFNQDKHKRQQFEDVMNRAFKFVNDCLKTRMNNDHRHELVLDAVYYYYLMTGYDRRQHTQLSGQRVSDQNHQNQLVARRLLSYLKTYPDITEPKNTEQGKQQRFDTLVFIQRLNDIPPFIPSTIFELAESLL